MRRSITPAEIVISAYTTFCRTSSSQGAARDQRVILRLAQKRRHPLKRFDESGEIRIAVARRRVFGFDFRPVARSQRDGGFRPDGSFEVKVQLGLGKGVDNRCLSRLRFDHGHDMLSSSAAAVAPR